MEFETGLKNEILSEIDNLGELEVGTEKYNNAIAGVTKLIDKAIEIEKVNVEFSDNQINREIDNDLKHKQLIDERRDRFAKNCIAVVGIAVPVLVTIWGALKSWEFERDDSISSTMGKGFMNRLLNKK